MKSAIAFASLAAFSLPAVAQEVPLTTQNPEMAVSAQLDQWIAAFEACDAQALSNVFTPQGVYAANTGQVLAGRQAIRDGVDGWMAGPLKPACRNAGKALKVERQPVRLSVIDGVAYSLTRFIIRVDPMKCAIDAGHILGVWRRQSSGEWLLEALAGNKDPMLPSNTCPSEPTSG